MLITLFSADVQFSSPMGRNMLLCPSDVGPAMRLALDCEWIWQVMAGAEALHVLVWFGLVSFLPVFCMWRACPRYPVLLHPGWQNRAYTKQTWTLPISWSMAFSRTTKSQMRNKQRDCCKPWRFGGYLLLQQSWLIYLRYVLCCHVERNAFRVEKL